MQVVFSAGFDQTCFQAHSMTTAFAPSAGPARWRAARSDSAASRIAAWDTSGAFAQCGPVHFDFARSQCTWSVLFHSRFSRASGPSTSRAPRIPRPSRSGVKMPTRLTSSGWKGGISFTSREVFSRLLEQANHSGRWGR